MIMMIVVVVVVMMVIGYWYDIGLNVHAQTDSNVMTQMAVFIWN
jgi:hypothetical protein